MSANEIINLNVGGMFFTTTRSTLCAEKGSMLAHKFSTESPFAPPITDSEGRAFLDRNPDYFKHVLNYLRMSCQMLPEPPTNTDTLRAIKAEADYFGLQGLVAICNDLVQNMEKVKSASGTGTGENTRRNDRKVVVKRFTHEDHYEATEEVLDEEYFLTKGYRIIEIQSCLVPGGGGVKPETIITALMEKKS